MGRAVRSVRNDQGGDADQHRPLPNVLQSLLRFTGGPRNTPVFLLAGECEFKRPPVTQTVLLPRFVIRIACVFVVTAYRQVPV